MKGFTALLVLWGAALGIAGCALPLGEDYLITRDGSAAIAYITDYDLINYVPIPKPGERPVILVDSRGDLEAAVAWKDKDGVEIPLPFEAFAADTVYQAEIRLSAKPGYGFYPTTPFAYPAGKIRDQTKDLGDPIRTVTVIYNNSDEWNITFITDYNLQNYVPVPLAGEKPVRSIDNRGDLGGTVTWDVETAPDDFDPFTGNDFQLHSVYRAKIDLAVKDGYRFSAARNFSYHDGTAAVPQGDGTAPHSRSFEVLYRATRTPIIIGDPNLTPYVPKPLSGTTAIMSFAASEYTGTITWKNTGTQEVLTGSFQPNTAYTAEVTLYPASGYTVTGLGQDFFVHTGAETISNPAASGAVTLMFPPTGSFGSPMVVYDTILTGRLPKPVSGMTPVMGITGAQYSGSVTWIPFDGVFQESVSYRAVLVLNPASGYTFTGIGPNAFFHGDAPEITNPADSGTVTITFPVTASSTYQVITSFGPVETETSALWMMRELKDDTYPLVIDLPDHAAEYVVPDSVILTAGINSPATVIINGHGGTLKINSPGTLLTIGGGVTLSLQNITLEGHNANNAPLVTVRPGGRLILGTGAVLANNQSAGNAGGVWVNGGTLVLNNGGVIKKMSAAASGSGGGVLLDANGWFYLNDGIIGGESSEDGNTVSGPDSGGGLLVKSGTVDMNGGTIQYNKAAGEHSGGGVYLTGDNLNKGTFNHNGGLITDNTADGSDSGGGVYLAAMWFYGSFTMTGPARVAANNRVFLGDGSAVIIIGGPLSSPVAADIQVGNDPPTGRNLVGAKNLSLGLTYVDRFTYNGENHIGGYSDHGDIYIWVYQ
ncbi:hypothetical protein LQZ21_08820 [Treponema sp. TIM-1]|uniref:hypothetical protein n=1 Tax=Treponema sp. TIM-1 TaxID=2898417 RepID=UPI00397EE329